MPTPERLKKTTKKIAEGLSYLSAAGTENAARQLSAIGDLEAVNCLGKFLTRHPYNYPVISALGKTGNPAAIPFLKKVIERTARSDQPAHQHEAISALGNLNRVEAIPILAAHAEKAADTLTRDHCIREAVIIAKGNPSYTPKTPVEKAIYLIAPHEHGDDALEVTAKAFDAARTGKISPKNARLYLKQLRAARGNLK